ncbi:MAG TPA: serine/threonine-protein kinase, partial [Candidatus Polarisedimenticolaceae bacterium]|nr:serine/threonine-protein kinase [Candidatus Polarisedimenticolaceae bacterium]
MPLRPGETLLHYRLVEQIGEGGMGLVWRAEDTTLDRQVAIKILPERFAADPSRLSRFEREAKALAALNDPGIASIYSVHLDAEVPFLAMELVEGEALRSRIGPAGMPLDELLELAISLADAVAAAHAAGIVHRDLKPDNVMRTARRRVKVLD